MAMGQQAAVRFALGRVPISERARRVSAVRRQVYELSKRDERLSRRVRALTVALTMVDEGSVDERALRSQLGAASVRVGELRKTLRTLKTAVRELEEGME